MHTEDLIAPDLILLLLAAPTRWPQAKNRINGITRLEKLLFLIDQECEYDDAPSEPFNFVAYHYGPYSKEVYESVELLEEAGLIAEEREFTDSALDYAEELLYSDTATEISYERQFILTPDGTSVAEYLSRAHPKLQQQLHKLKDKYAGLSLQDLIYDIYSRYPKYTERSVIREKIMGSSV